MTVAAAITVAEPIVEDGHQDRSRQIELMRRRSADG